jgi:hypothetical protein
MGYFESSKVSRSTKKIYMRHKNQKTIKAIIIKKYETLWCKSSIRSRFNVAGH